MSRQRLSRASALVVAVFALACFSWWIADGDVDAVPQNPTHQQLRRDAGEKHELRAVDAVPVGEVPTPSNIFVAFYAMREEDHGWGAYARTLLSVLGKVAPLRLPPLEPDDATTAVFVQGLDPLGVSWLRRLGPDHRLRQAGRIFVGVFAAGDWSQVEGAVGLLNNTVYLAETHKSYKECQAFVTLTNSPSQPFTMRCARVPTAVDVDTLTPVLPRENRTLPVVYVKRYDGYGTNETKLLDVTVRRAGVHAFRVLRTSRRPGFEVFSQGQYHLALSQAPFMVAFTPADNWGNFLLEAAAMDVPVFLITGGVPSWFGKEHGEVVDVNSDHFDDWDEADVVERLKRFIADLSRFTPREAVSRDLSLDAVARIVTDVVFEGGQGMVHDFPEPV